MMYGLVWLEAIMSALDGAGSIMCDHDDVVRSELLFGCSHTLSFIWHDMFNNIQCEPCGVWNYNGGNVS